MNNYDTSLIISVFMVVIFLFAMIKTLINKVIPTVSVNRVLEQSSTVILEDLDFIIEKECRKIIDIELVYYTTRSIPEREMSSLNRKMVIISDQLVDDLTIQASTNILDKMSPSFRDRLSLVIDENKIEDYIINEIYHILITVAMNINK